MADRSLDSYTNATVDTVDPTSELITEGASTQNIELNVLVAWLATRLPDAMPGTTLTDAQKAFLARYGANTLIPVVTVDPDPLPPTGSPWFHLPTAKFRHAVETPGAAATTTSGTVVFANAPNGGLLFDADAGLGSEGGLAEEVTKIGWDSSSNESFEVRVTNATDPQGPGLTDATIGTVSVRQLAQLNRTSEGYYELSGQAVARGDIVAGRAYAVTLTGQRPAFRAEMLVAENLDIDGADGADGDDGWSPVFEIEADGTREVLRIDDWTGGTGTKPATGYVGATGIVTQKADGANVRGSQGPPGTGSGTAVDPASEAEAEAGTVSDKYISPLTLGEVLEHVRATAANVTAGSIGRLVDAAVLKGVIDTLNAAIAEKAATTNIEDVALKSILDADLSDDVKQAFRERIGAESEDGEYGPTVTSSQRYGGGIPGGLGLGPTIPDGATHLLFTITAETEQLINYTTRELLVSQFLSLPNRNQGSNAISNSSGVIETNFDQRQTDTPGADAQRGYIAHNGRRILYASDQSVGAAIRVQFKESRVEPWALRDNTERLPHDKLPEDVVVLEQGKISNNLIDFPPSTGSQPPAGTGYYPDADRQKLVGIERGAEVNVKSDWNATTGPEEILNKPDVPPVASALPTALATSTNRVQVQENSPRRDLGIQFAARPGGDFNYGGGLGSISNLVDRTSAYITSNIGGIRYSGTAFQLDFYVLDVSLDGGAWTRVWFQGVELTIAQEFGLTTIPWQTADTSRYRHFRTAVIPQASRPTFADPVAVNLQDTEADAGQQFIAGNPFVREATEAPIADQFPVLTAAEYAAAEKVVGHLYFVRPA